MSDSPPPSYASLLGQNPRRNPTIAVAVARDPRIPHPDAFLIPPPITCEGRKRAYVVTKGLNVGVFRDWALAKSYIHRIPDNCHHKSSSWEEALGFYRQAWIDNTIELLPPPRPLPGNTVNQPLYVSSRDPSPMPGSSSRPFMVASSPANPVQRTTPTAQRAMPMAQRVISTVQRATPTAQQSTSTVQRATSTVQQVTSTVQRATPSAQQATPVTPTARQGNSTVRISQTGPPERPVFVIEDTPSPSPERTLPSSPTSKAVSGKGKGNVTSTSYDHSGSPQHQVATGNMRPIEATVCGASGTSTHTPRPTEAVVCGAGKSKEQPSSPIHSLPVSHASTYPPSTPPKASSKHSHTKGPWTPVSSSSPSSSSTGFSSPPIGRVLFPHAPSAPHPGPSAHVTVTVSVSYNPPGPTPPRPRPFNVREPSAPLMPVEHALSLFPGRDDPDPDHTGAGYDWGDDLTLEDLQHCQDVEDIAYFESSTPPRHVIASPTPPRPLRRRHD